MINNIDTVLKKFLKWTVIIIIIVTDGTCLQNGPSEACKATCRLQSSWQICGKKALGEMTVMTRQKRL